MATAHTTSHASEIGAMAAGKLLAKATGGKLWPTILVLVGIVLLRRVAAAHAAAKGRAHAQLGVDG